MPLQNGEESYRARKVAQAAGGFLGFGDKMSPAESSMLSELEQAFA